MSRRPRRMLRVGVEPLEGRVALASDVDAAEVYTWQLVNTMRADPARFADDIQALYSGTPGTYHGYAATDPAWSDLRAQVDRNPAGNGWSLASMLDFLRAQPKLPPLLLQDDLSARATDHTLWMEQHGFAHTGTTTRGADLPGFAIAAAAAPDAFDHDAAKYAMPMGENINYGYDTDWAFEADYKAGTLSRDGFVQRLAYVSAMSYVLDVGLPDLGHLRNLLGRPAGMAGTSGKLSITNYDSIGISLELTSYQQDADVPNYYVSTMRFDNVRGTAARPGQYKALTFADADGDGTLDVGEAYQLAPGVPTSGGSTPTEASPQVAGLRAVRSRQKGLTAVVVAFDAAMDPATTTQLGAYSLAAAKAGKKARPAPIRLKRAAYDEATHSVTLTLAKPYKAAGRLVLSVAAGPTSSSGVAIAAPYSAAVPR